MKRPMSFSKLIAQHQHRPWPMPDAPWVMSQRWLDLLFAHWSVSPELLAPLIPKGLELDLFDGQAYLAVVPFRMEAVKPRLSPSVPWLSAFPELNLRTYVTYEDKPGVWFFSLDAGNPVAVRVARSVFHLPYFDAQMTLQKRGDYIRYRSHRTHRQAHPADLRMLYKPTGKLYQATPGTLEHSLTERYCLYAADGQERLYRGEIHHKPWPLQRAEAEFQLNTMAQMLGLPLQREPDLLHFARRLDVVVWPLERLTP